jgi:cytochrome bd ubiquinol oxidase subunit I
MKIAASEAQWNTCEPCGFSIFQIGGFSQQNETPSFSITIPDVLSWMATGSFGGKVEGLNQLQQQEQRSYGRGNYMPNVRLMYWSMRVMAMLGVAMFLIAAAGAWLYHRRKLQTTRWFLWIAVVGMSLPYIAATAGWILTEMGRQPWIVQNLLKTSAAVSTGLSTATIAASLTVFLLLYTVLGVVEFMLMRHYARLDPPQVDRAGAGAPMPQPFSYGGD